MTNCSISTWINFFFATIFFKEDKMYTKIKQLLKLKSYGIFSPHLKCNHLLSAKTVRVWLTHSFNSAWRMLSSTIINLYRLVKLHPLKWFSSFWAAELFSAEHLYKMSSFAWNVHFETFFETCCRNNDCLMTSSTGKILLFFFPAAKLRHKDHNVCLRLQPPQSILLNYKHNSCVMLKWQF